jgi:hypothetical protein
MLIPQQRQAFFVVRHTMTDQINIEEIIELVRQQVPNRQDLIMAFQNCSVGQWTSKAYFRFVDGTNANQVGAEWQFDENVIIESETLGTLVIDYLKDKRIGGIEILKNI